jgi:propionyl-CoA carboxylase beta chain
MTIEKKLEKLKEKTKAAELGGGKQRIEKQHQAGKLTALERIKLLLDEGSFQEMDKLVVHQSRDFGMAPLMGGGCLFLPRISLYSEAL